MNRCARVRKPAQYVRRIQGKALTVPCIHHEYIRLPHAQLQNFHTYDKAQG